MDEKQIDDFITHLKSYEILNKENLSWSYVSIGLDHTATTYSFDFIGFSFIKRFECILISGFNVKQVTDKKRYPQVLFIPFENIGWFYISEERIPMKEANSHLY